MAPTGKTPFGHFTGQISHSIKMFAISDCLVASKPKTKTAVIQDTFRRFGSSIGQIAQSNKMFTISNYILGLKSKAIRRGDAIRAKTDRFRVLVIGRVNAGKTTILQKVCNTSEKPEIFDSEGNKVRLHSANYRHNADALVMIRSIHRWLRPPRRYKIGFHHLCYADILSARIAQHRKRAGVSEQPRIYFSRFSWF